MRRNALNKYRLIPVTSTFPRVASVPVADKVRRPSSTLLTVDHTEMASVQKPEMQDRRSSVATLDRLAETRDQDEHPQSVEHAALDSALQEREA